ncbi:mycofactocin oligosaccharide methyltransferase MftM [Rudaeicoccus suwonensis]|uniref:Methyltransferase family protein n=1 Tax=Rudaeicoccus suwonensis TaxID=657409 RepID=A0A561E8P9_9MICO|nr:mycofactocin oligosaccharide methyltransferase MftM [Rudaeicoccus suwonensis]TWE11940.1 methyltransferase family protein [Rudaeicoccus suwonensis]
MTTIDEQPIDPMAAAPGGRYHDGYVTVVRGAAPAQARLVATTPIFGVYADDGLLVTHTLRPDQLDDDLTGLLNTQLFEPGWVRGVELFERIFTGVVLTSADEPLDAWELYYRNTIRREKEGPQTDAPPGGVDDFTPVHQHAADLVAGHRVLELGCCFGFLSLRLAERGHDVTASDFSEGTVRLLEQVAPRLGAPLTTLVADAGHVPLTDRCVDTVLAVHLLEHLDAAHGERVLRESLRLAARRVVVAVPYETEADEAFGHVRTIDEDDLRDWGRRSGCAFDVHSFHGGWLVLDH